MQNFESSPLSIYFYEKLFSLIDLFSNSEPHLASIIENHLKKMPPKSSGIIEAVKMISLDQKEVLRIIKINFSNIETSVARKKFKYQCGR